MGLFDMLGAGDAGQAPPPQITAAPGQYAQMSGVPTPGPALQPNTNMPQMAAPGPVQQPQQPGQSPWMRLLQGLSMMGQHSAQPGMQPGGMPMQNLGFGQQNNNSWAQHFAQLQQAMGPMMAGMR